jgi:uncharacterized LabA/DUF88 family protein
LKSANRTNGLSQDTQDSDPVPDRAVVFVDYQNLYKGAREAFGYKANAAGGHFGNIRPYSLGRVLTRGSDRTLKQVRVYTGVPTPRHAARANAIMQRRVATWVSDYPTKVEVFPRPLSYPPPEGREKGVDVELAIDIVRLALDDEYDLAIIASADTDLVPALVFVHERCEGKSVEAVTWAPEAGYEADTAAPIDIPGGGLTRITVPKRDFDRIADRRNFMISKDDPEKVLGKSRWDKIKGRMDR